MLFDTVLFSQCFAAQRRIIMKPSSDFLSPKASKASAGLSFGKALGAIRTVAGYFCPPRGCIAGRGSADMVLTV